MQKGGSVYILSSPNRNTLYIGVSANLRVRVWEHRNKQYPGSFSARYNCVMLVYYRHYPTILDAIAEEKRIKRGSRKGKEMLIDSMNKDWRDLWDEIQDW